MCFPAFGPWPLGPQHGFARTSTWKQDGEISTDEVVCCVNVEIVAEMVTISDFNSPETSLVSSFSSRAPTLLPGPTHSVSHSKVFKT